jgi:8-amino-7-oxononanoate synthase
VTDYKKTIQQLKKEGRYRKRISTRSPQDVYLKVNNRTLSNFSSNNYLNLANSLYLKNQFKTHISRYGVGSGSSPLISGYSIAHSNLEKKISRLLGFESTLVTNSGYLSNVGLLNAVSKNKIDVFQDRENHNSIIESSRLSNTKLIRYKHLNYEDLEEKILSSDSKDKIIFADSVFSMTGEKSDLIKLSSIAKKYKCLLFIDDAHGFGVSAYDSRIFPSSINGLDKRKLNIDAYIGTFGKAIGTFGAFISGSNNLIDLLIQQSKPYVYSTALPPALASTTLDSINYIMKNKSITKRLESNINLFKDLAGQNKIKVSFSNSPIQTIHIGDPKRVMSIYKKAQMKNIYIQAIRYPTVPLNKDLIRINITSDHSKKQIQSLIEFLKQVQ